MFRIKVWLPFLGPFYRARSFFRNPLRFIARRLFRFSLRLGIFGISFGYGGFRLSIRLGIFSLLFGRRRKKSGGGKNSGGGGQKSGGGKKSGGGDVQ